MICTIFIQKDVLKIVQII